MAIYLIGDIQGCYKELILLLKQVNFNPNKDELWPAGDVVAREEDSLTTLRYLQSLGDSCKMVLGNHDLHLLATYHQIKKPKKQDKLDKLLAAPDLPELITWLGKQPLLRQIGQENAYLSHAGLSPQWTIKTAIKQARFAEARLHSKQQKQWLELMYGNEPNDWHHSHSEIEIFRYTINSLTRMRYCYQDNTLEFAHKSPPPSKPSSKIHPWFEQHPHLANNSWVFGHWAALMGQTQHQNLYALDTGCVWGGQLTLLRWHDKALFRQDKIS